MKVMEILELSNGELLDYFKDAIRDDNYNPTCEPYNTSGFTLGELQSEISRRMADWEL